MGASGRAGGPQYERGRRIIKCSRCGRQGHNATTCPDEREEEDSDSEREVVVAKKRGRPKGSKGGSSSEGHSSGASSSSAGISTPNLDVDDNDDEVEEEEPELFLDPALVALQEEEEGGQDVGVGTFGWEDFAVHALPINQLRSGHAVQAPIHPAAPLVKQGGINIPPETNTPASFLDLLFTEDILETFVNNTNSFVAAQNPAPWSALEPLTVPELKCFFGICLYMGVCQLPERKMYWEKDIFRCKFVPAVMGCKRFLAISYNLHWLDASGMTAEERAAENKKDGFWTVETFLSALVANFRHYYSCGVFLSVDEMCIFFKGRHRCKCYNPLKPNK